MADSVIFLKKGGEGYYEEKKSRFLAAAYRISDEQEALAYIEAARKNIGTPDTAAMRMSWVGIMSL